MLDEHENVEGKEKKHLHNEMPLRLKVDQRNDKQIIPLLVMTVTVTPLDLEVVFVPVYEINYRIYWQGFVRISGLFECEPDGISLVRDH